MARRTRRTLFSIVVVVLAACSPSGSDDAVVPGSDGSVPVVTGDAPATDAPSTEVVSSDDPTSDGSDGGTQVTFGGGTTQLVDPALGLENVPLAQATLTATFEGTRDGAPEQWTQIETSMTSTAPPLAQFSSERTGAGGFAVQHVSVDGMTYFERCHAPQSSRFSLVKSPKSSPSRKTDAVSLALDTNKD